jgi:hypothetical protein
MDDQPGNALPPGPPPPEPRPAAGTPAAPEPPPPTGLPATPPGPVAPAAPAAPGGFYPATHTEPGAPVPPQVAPPKRRRGLIGVGAALLTALVAILLKFGLPLLLGAAATGVLGSVFGGAYGKLPSDQQKALEARFDAAIGTTLDGKSDVEKTAAIDAMITSGLPRLDDAPLVDKIHLTVKLLNGTDEATCAKLARATASGKEDSDALLKSLDALDTDSVGRWYDINIQAIEADAASRPVRTADNAAAERILTTIASGLSATEAAQISALYSGTGTASDADACGGIRTLYNRIDALPPSDLAIAALYDASP